MLAEVHLCSLRQVYHFQTQPNDIVVVASDGLFDNVQDAKIVEVRALLLCDL